MNVVIRADASVKIGIGHIMRCLTLADRLKEKGAYVTFICARISGNLIDTIKQRGYEVRSIMYENHCLGSKNLHDDAKQTINILSNMNRVIDLLIIDHYEIDIKWQKLIRPYVKKIMVIDDLANRKHDCDILLDQNWYENMEIRYSNLVPTSCKQILGPTYALLRQEFFEARKNLRSRTGKLERLLVSFGGSDPANETSRVLDCLIKHRLYQMIEINVIAGVNNTYKDIIKGKISGLDNIRFYEQVDNIAYLMNQADVCIGAAGTSSWERCFLGLPAIMITIADNQIEIAKAIHKLGMGIYIGESNNVNDDQIISCIIDLIEDGRKITVLQEKCLSFMNENGTEKVCNYIYKIFDLS